jgi:hypothetical protein
MVVVGQVIEYEAVIYSAPVWEGSKYFIRFHLGGKAAHF